ncbi:MAG TPA: CPBP family glutamic-type intramembrane protease [Pyrinomonadaceae bacterium]|nr:CPBP family glutamic-type intramembrane protease [Pyrinomonadaceae bacterium]
MFIVLLCALAVEWLILPFSKNPFIIALPILIALAAICFSHRRRGESLKDIGYRFDNFLECWQILILPMLLFFVFLTILGWFLGSLRLDDFLGAAFFRKYVWLFAWGLIQQHALQAFFNRRAQEIWNKGLLSIFVTASIFALLHLPNFWLTVATFFGGLMWAAVYQRVPNLFALALSHGIMSGVLVMTMPRAALHGMRVGYNYFLL